MTQLNNSDREIGYLKDKIARMSDREVINLNHQALVTLLFIYSDGGNEFSDEDISDYPNLAQRNRIVHSAVSLFSICSNATAISQGKAIQNRGGVRFF